MTAEPRVGLAVRDVVIIGSGVAGYTAAIYAARAEQRPLVFEGEVTAGGALMTTTDVENYPGFSEGVLGPALMAQMRAQAQRFGAELVRDDVTAVDLTVTPKSVTAGGTRYRASAVILAMGAKYRMLGLPNEEELTGRGVSCCATCDGFFFRDRVVAVVGGGDSALEEAVFLTRFASTVVVVHRRRELRASKILQERAFLNPRIEFAWNSEVKELHGGDRLTGITLANTISGVTHEMPLEGLFIAIGHEPRSDLVIGQIDLQDGYVVVDHPSTRTNVAGVFACGDLVDRHYRQAVTAAGAGCSAALDAERYIAALKHQGSSAGDVAATLAETKGS